MGLAGDLAGAAAASEVAAANDGVREMQLPRRALTSREFRWVLLQAATAPRTAGTPPHPTSRTAAALGLRHTGLARTYEGCHDVWHDVSSG